MSLHKNNMPQISLGHIKRGGESERKPGQIMYKKDHLVFVALECKCHLNTFVVTGWEDNTSLSRCTVHVLIKLLSGEET